MSGRFSEVMKIYLDMGGFFRRMFEAPSSLSSPSENLELAFTREVSNLDMDLVR